MFIVVRVGLKITGSALISQVPSLIEFLYLGMESCDVDSLEMETDIDRGERGKFACVLNQSYGQ